MINGITPIRAPQSIELPGSVGTGSASGFSGVMNAAMQSVQGRQDTAHESAARLLAGENVDLHKVALDQQNAAIAFDMFLQVRNKVVQAYQEVMRMQI